MNRNGSLRTAIVNYSRIKTMLLGLIVEMFRYRNAEGPIHTDDPVANRINVSVLSILFGMC